MTDLDPRILRDAFGRFMTGVTIVAGRDSAGAPVGFTANSFASVSLDPPLLLVCPGKRLSSYAAFANCARFTVSVLAEGQEAVSNIFAGDKGDRFAKVAHSFDAHDLPLIDGAIAQFSCATHKWIDAGDHGILIGEVTALAHDDRPGLGYLGGQYFSLGLERAAFETSAAAIVGGAIVEAPGGILLEQTPQGYRPPQTSVAARTNLRTSLAAALARRGISAELGQVYSVFDDRAAGCHYAYLLASAPDARATNGLRVVPVADLPQLDYASAAVAVMMTRFAAECLTRNFSLYLGDADRGDVHTT